MKKDFCDLCGVEIRGFFWNLFSTKFARQGDKDRRVEFRVKFVVDSNETQEICESCGVAAVLAAAEMRNKSAKTMTDE